MQKGAIPVAGGARAVPSSTGRATSTPGASWRQDHCTGDDGAASSSAATKPPPNRNDVGPSTVNIKTIERDKIHQIATSFPQETARRYL